MLGTKEFWLPLTSRKKKKKNTKTFTKISSFTFRRREKVLQVWTGTNNNNNNFNFCRNLEIQFKPNATCIIYPICSQHKGQDGDVITSQFNLQFKLFL